MKILIILSCVLGLALSRIDGEDGHKALQELAAKIMQNLQKEHIPTDGSHSGPVNQHIHHLYGSELISKTDKTKITIGVKGVQFVSVEANGKVVNMSTAFGMGAVATYNVKKDDIEEQLFEYQALESDESEDEIDNGLQTMIDEYLSDYMTAIGNETKVIIAKKDRFGIKVKGKGQAKKDVQISGTQGYIVAAKTNVTKGYAKP